MKKIIFKSVLVALMLSFFISCKSAKLFEDSEYMHIMVYDLTNSPVQSMRFYLDGKNVGETDVYGRLTIPLGLNFDTETHVIKGEKETFLSVEETFIKSAGSVLYFKTGTVQMYLDNAELSIDKGEYNQALSYIESAEKMDSGEDILFLKAVVYKKMGKTAEYEQIMKNFKNLNI